MTDRAAPVAGVVVLLAVVGAVAATVVRPPEVLEATQVQVLVALTVALVVAASLPLRIGADDGHLLTLEDAVLLAMLVVVPVGILPWLVLLGTLLHELRRGARGSKLLFNTGLAGFAAAVAVGEVILLAGVAEEGLLQTIGVAAFGVAAAAIVQLVAIAILFARLDGSPWREHLDVRGFLDVALGLNLALGAVLAAAIVAAPALAWLAIVTVALLGLVMRSMQEPHSAV